MKGMSYINMDYLKKIGYFSAATLSLVSVVALPVSAEAKTTSTSTPNSATATTGSSDNSTSAQSGSSGSSNKSAAEAQQTAHKRAQAAANQARLARIIAKGNAEINRRLATLKTLDAKISRATKLSARDTATLSATVNTDITNLTSLETQLDADTTVSAAISDAQSIINSYRVYALVVPQINIIKTADDQQVAEGKLTTLSLKLSSRITAAQQKGTNVTALLASLADLNSKTSAAQTISSSIESGVIGLVPSDYNSNHSVLGGDGSRLKTAQADIKAAIADAQAIITQLPASSSKT
jgi:hypothetical protein